MDNKLIKIDFDQIITYLNIDNEKYIAYTEYAPADYGDDVLFGKIVKLDNGMSAVIPVSNNMLSKVNAAYEKFILSITDPDYDD